MSKKIVKTKLVSTNVRYIKPRQRGTHLFPKEKRMINHHRIIEEYRNADTEKRMYLFLSHRSLRDEFIKIDQRDASLGFSKKHIKSKCHMCANWRQRLISAFK
jgi:hypothetical protein